MFAHCLPISRQCCLVLFLAMFYFSEFDLVAIEITALPNKKAQDLYREAENSLSQGEHLKAQANFRSLLKAVNPQQVGQQTYIDISLRYIDSLIHERNYDEAHAAIDKILKMRLKDDLLIKINLLKVELYKIQDKPNEAYATLQKLEKQIPIDRWSKEQQLFAQEIKQLLNTYYSEQIRHADLLFNATLYIEASEIYADVLEGIAQGNYPDVLKDTERGQELTYQLRYRVALMNYLAGNNTKAIALLEEANSPELPKNSALRAIHNQGLYLAALAHKNLEEHEKSIALLRAYLQSEDQPLPKHDEALLEIGMAHFELGQFSIARENLEALNQKKNVRSDITNASRLHLARIEIAEGKAKDAEKALSDIEMSVKTENPLYYEILYYHGEAFYQMQEYVKAVDYFERILPKRNFLMASWYYETLERIGSSYLKLADDPSLDTTQQLLYFDKAEATFKLLLEASKDERAYLAMGNYYLVRGRRLNDKVALQQAEKLLSKSEAFISQDAQTQSLILRTEAASSYADRDKLYRQLTLEIHKDSPLYAQGWYLRGLNDFEEGQRLLKMEQPQEANKAFERAVNSLKKSFEMLQSKDKLRAALSLKYQAQAFAYQNTHESWNKAFLILDDLVQTHSDIWTSLPDPDEIFYLKALLASQIAIDPEKEHYAVIAEKSLQDQIVRFPDGKYVDEALNLLGAISYQKKNYLAAKEYFVKLASDHPTSPSAAEALFWAAKSAEELKENSQIIKNYRQNLFEKYPLSPFAAEAYFTYYSYVEYINGDTAAIKHLQAMQTLFPDSPLLLNANYLIGLDFKKVRKTKEGKLIHRRNLTAAIDAFHEVESIFDTLYQKKLLPTKDLDYFITIRYRATIERALANAAIAEESKGAKRQIYLEYAADVFRQINRDFDKADHPLTQYLTLGETYTSIQEQSEFGLAQTYVQANQDELANKTLIDMIEKYHAAKITRGYFLSQAWSQRAQISMRQGDYLQALSFFSSAEDAGKGKVLNSDEKLDIWIQQSLCFMKMKEFDQAMLILSKVINEDAASSLRLKAMVLRAEIYQQQGRHELARKQLEATAKKGGEWALKAKEKLEKDYGYQ